MPKDNAAPVLMDKRVVERNIKKGLLTREEYEKHLASLPDRNDLAEPVRVSLLAERGGSSSSSNDDDLDDDEDLDDEDDEPEED